MNPPTKSPAGQPPAPDDTPFKTDVVQNIPMQTQAPNGPPKDKDDVELDLMMQDVGQELKKNVKRSDKHHFFSKNPKGQPIPQPSHTAAQPAPPPPAPQPPTQAQNQAQPASKAAAKPKTKHSIPIFIILVTIIITAAFIVVTVATYKQK